MTFRVAGVGAGYGGGRSVPCSRAVDPRSVVLFSLQMASRTPCRWQQRAVVDQEKERSCSLDRKWYPRIIGLVSVCVVLGAGTLISGGVAQASNGDPILLGMGNLATSSTTISTTSGIGLLASTTDTGNVAGLAPLPETEEALASRRASSP